MGGDAIQYVGACASCKHQRKRCDTDCKLSRYFPAARNEEFQTVHKLFGINNFLKILNSIPEDQKDTAAETLILEAKIRKDHPVHGCLAVEKELCTQIKAHEEKLNFVMRQLSFVKEMEKLQEQNEKLEVQFNQHSLALLHPKLDQSTFYYQTPLEEVADIETFGNTWPINGVVMESNESQQQHALSYLGESAKSSIKSEAELAGIYFHDDNGRQG